MEKDFDKVKSNNEILQIIDYCSEIINRNEQRYIEVDYDNNPSLPDKYAKNFRIKIAISK